MTEINMKKFLFKIFQLLSIMALFVFFMEIAIFLCKEDIFSERTMENKYIDVVNDSKWANKIQSSRKIFLVGASSVRYGLSCTQLNKLSNDTLSFVNLALSGGDAIEMYFILKHLDLTGVKAVYYGLDPWVFSKYYYRNKSPHLYLDLNLLQAFRLSLKMDKPIFLSRYYAFYHYLFPSKEINNNINQKIPEDFGSKKLVRKPTNFNTPVNLVKWFQVDRYGWSQLNFIYLKKIADLCKKNNIEFSTFVPPKRSDLSKAYKLQCNLIHKEYINNLIKLNFKSQIFGKFDELDSLGDKNLFSESFHLNKQGQWVYTKVFYQMTLNKKMIFSQEYSWFNKN